jgi:DNA-binding winged helix-turn-helix (wHTH) protein
MTVNEWLQTASRYRLGRWLVDQGACRISDDARSTKVEPRAMAVLGHLVANADRTVTREELLDEIWGTRHVVDEALTKCVSQLRQALVDDPRRPTFIETVPKIGYRLLVQPATWTPPLPAPPAATPLLEPQPSLAASKAPRRVAYLIATLVILGSVMVAASMLR